MLNFEYVRPTKVIFGKDTESQVGCEIKSRGFKKVLLHYGDKDLFTKTGLLDKVRKSLRDSEIEFVELDGVVPNPRMSLVKKGVELCKQENVDFVLAIGGGSAIDSSKAICYGLANDFVLEDLFMGKVTTTKINPVGVISTIAATGSETSNSTVVTIDTLGDVYFKKAYNHDCGRPLFAIMNPELTYTLPKYQTCSGAADIMMHTMERYFTNVEDVLLTDRIAEGLLVTVRDATLNVIDNPNDYTTRADLMWAGSISHCGFTGTGRIGDYATHKIGHELSGMYDVTHGASLTAIWSSWAKFVLETNVPRFARFAHEVFNVEMNYFDLRETALKGIEEWDNWCKKIGMPTSLTELGVNPTEEEYQLMADICTNKSTSIIGNFRNLKSADVVTILKNAK